MISANSYTSPLPILYTSNDLLDWINTLFMCAFARTAPLRYVSSVYVN